MRRSMFLILVSVTACSPPEKNGGDTSESTTTTDEVTTPDVEPENAAPVVESVIVQPDAPTTNDVLEATATATDSDGDTLVVSYEWFVDETSVQMGESALLDGADFFDKGQSVYVVVTASDGSLDGTATSDPVSVGNTPPATPTVVVTPDVASPGEDLVCSVTEPSADDDDDDITYTP